MVQAASESRHKTASAAAANLFMVSPPSVYETLRAQKSSARALNIAPDVIK